MKRFVATLSACAALALASQAVAEEYVKNSATVTVAGVNFSDSAQVDALYGKLKTSARKTCRGDARFLNSRADERSCREAALDAAVAKISRDPLASRHTPKLASAGR